VGREPSKSEGHSGETEDSWLSLPAYRDMGAVGVGAEPLERLLNRTPTFLRNSRLASAFEVLPRLSIGRADLDAAARRLRRWGPSLAILFPELRDSLGAQAIWGSVSALWLPLLAFGHRCAVGRTTTGHPCSGRSFPWSDTMIRNSRLCSIPRSVPLPCLRLRWGERAPKRCLIQNCTGLRLPLGA
jgi:hypothetical protein